LLVNSFLKSLLVLFSRGGFVSLLGTPSLVDSPFNLLTLLGLTMTITSLMLWSCIVSYLGKLGSKVVHS